MLAIDWKSYECRRCEPPWKTPPCESQVEASRLVADHLATHGISMSPQIVDARDAEIELLQRQRADLLRELKALRDRAGWIATQAGGRPASQPVAEQWVRVSELDALIRRYERGEGQ